MIGYAEALWPETIRHQLEDATALVKKLPAKDKAGRWVRCHELARACAPYLAAEWKLVDGQVGPVEHSWLERKDPAHVVLDLYVPTRVPQVQLVDLSPHFQRNLYYPGPRRRDIRRKVIAELQLLLGPPLRTWPPKWHYAGDFAVRPPFWPICNANALGGVTTKRDEVTCPWCKQFMQGAAE